LLPGSTNYQSPFWVSFKQALDLGGHVKKGEKSALVIYFKILETGNMLVHEDGRPARMWRQGDANALSSAFSTRRLHRETTGSFSGTVAKFSPKRAELRPLLRTAGASNPRPFRRRRGRNAAQFPRIIGFCLPILFVLALPQAPAPGE
jgi:hypothetical protein